MNRRLITPFLLLVAAAALFQWWQRTRILTSETELRAELGQLKDLRAQSPAAPVRPVGPAANSSLQKAETFDPDKFVEEFLALVPLLRDARTQAPAETSDLQQRALALISQIGTAPPALVKQAYEKMMKSSLPDEGKEELSQPFLLRLAETEPAWAAAQCVKMVKFPHILRNLIEVWAAQDAGAAKAWIETAVKEGSLAGYEANIVEILMNNVASAQASSDPMTALKELPGLSPEGQRQSVTKMAGSLKTTDERRAALERIAGGDQVTDQNFLTLRHFANALGENAGFDAGRAALDAAKLSPHMHDATAAIIAATGIGPETAARANWLLENRRTAEPEALEGFIQTWTKADYNGAATWLSDLPPSASRDTAVAAFAPLVAQKEPPSAVDWAITITDPAQRTTALNQVWKDWKAHAPEEAASYFREKGLPSPE